MNGALYVEAFVEDTDHGYRFRVCQSDPGLMHVKVENWNDETKKWVHEDSASELTFAAEFAELLCEAISKVAATADTD